MSYLDIVVIGISLAMDAFTVAICKGLAIDKMNYKKALHIGMYFALFQAIMPMIGYFLGFFLNSFVSSIGHLIIFFLLIVIGANMIYEAYCVPDKELDSYVDLYSMFLPALATSLDAFSVGVAFSFLKVKLFIAVATIGLLTLILTSFGAWVGGKVNKKSRNMAKIFGGIVLIIMAFKMLLEHL